MEQHPTRLRAALIGDVIASRQTEDREALQSQLRESIMTVNQAVVAIQPLTMTIGDEFQAAYAALPAALEAALRLHLILLPVSEIRIGVGWGELYFGGESSPLDQDGPCWWRARDALDDLKKGPTKARRTGCVTATAADSMIAGYLQLSDQILDGFDATDGLIGTRLLDGVSQSQIADEIGVHKSSINRRAHGHGILTLVGSLPVEIPIEAS